MNDYAYVTGVLGAELREDNPALPVPVVRVSCSQQGRIIKVKWDSPGPTYDGKTWETAYHYVQQAIDSAASGDEVWVAAGTYQEASAIVMKSGVGLYGGFAGTEVAREQRNWALNKTVLDGGRQHNVVTMISVDGCCIDGFIIRKGLGTGGGIYCSSAKNSIIRNNVIRENTTASSGGSGGGLYAYGSSLTIAGNVFVGNTSSSGGGIYYNGPTSSNIINNTIIRNLAVQQGGGIYLASSSPVLWNNILAYNEGGGVYKNSGPAPQFQKNLVHGNTVYEYSGMSVPPTDLNPALDPGIPSVELGCWHISGNSPCRNQGVYFSDLGDKDIDCENRIHDSTVDVGADEWNGADPPVIQPTVIHVKPDGDDGNSGASWTNAVATVQRGIELADEAGGGEVWVSHGTYGTAELRPFVKVYGGFAVNDDEQSDRNWNTRVTTLDGGGLRNVVTMNGVFDCTVDGFTIRGGDRGIHIYRSFGTVSHNIIRDNGILNGDGSGIYCEHSLFTIANNFVAGNAASRYGGGLYINNSKTSVLNNSIAKNTASVAGGLYILSGSHTITNNIVAFNSSGIYLSGTSTVLKYNNLYGNPRELSPVLLWNATSQSERP